jgi:transposase-like protein
MTGVDGSGPRSSVGRREVRSAVDTADDVCPMCNAELGSRRGATRRQIIFCATPGVFRWRCPDCAGVWQVDHRARSLPVSVTAS